MAGLLSIFTQHAYQLYTDSYQRGIENWHSPYKLKRFGLLPLYPTYDLLSLFSLRLFSCLGWKVATGRFGRTVGCFDSIFVSVGGLVPLLNTQKPLLFRVK